MEARIGAGEGPVLAPGLGRTRRGKGLGAEPGRETMGTDDMGRHFEVTVEAGEAGTRLDRLLVSRLAELSRSRLQALIREHVRLAALFEEWVQAEPGWEVSAPRLFSTVCFRHLEADNDEIVRLANEGGRIFIAPTKLRGETVLRLAIGNGWTSEDDVRIAWEVLRE